MNFISALQQFSIEMLKDYLGCPKKIVVSKDAYFRIAQHLDSMSGYYEEKLDFTAGIFISTMAGRVEIAYEDEKD